ncbi:hypothetical protein [Kibdelosporangium philippinense]|uniref:hypothetical protein n=1 Tax=Kibdelosporangium philippinense TaxID=211113 RepID=UPI0036070672
MWVTANAKLGITVPLADGEAMINEPTVSIRFAAYPEVDTVVERLLDAADRALTRSCDGYVDVRACMAGRVHTDQAEVPRRDSPRRRAAAVGAHGGVPTATGSSARRASRIFLFIP